MVPEEDRKPTPPDLGGGGVGGGPLAESTWHKWMDDCSRIHHTINRNEYEGKNE